MANEKIELSVSDEHINKIISGSKTAKAICEMIWNSLDADATKIEISFERNELGKSVGGGITDIIIKDDGHGIDYGKRQEAFGFLGKSQKTLDAKSPKGRSFHGKNGQGRYFAFAIGKSVSWESTYEDRGTKKTFSISASKTLRTLDITEEVPAPKNASTGVIVKISSIPKKTAASLDPKALKIDVLPVLANYLKTYEGQGISITIDGEAMDLKEALLGSKQYKTKIIPDGGVEPVDFSMDVFHWKNKAVHSRFFCLLDGTTIDEDTNTGVKISEFGHSVYVKSKRFDEAEKAHTFLLLKGMPLFDQISEWVRDCLLNFSAEIRREKSKKIVDELKKSDLYPYKDLPKDEIEEAKREMFDLSVGMVVGGKSENIIGKSQETKAMVLNLIKNAIDNNPQSLLPILEEVAGLNNEDADMLRDLLDRHSLQHIIHLSKRVSDKIDCLEEIERIIFSDGLKEKTLERKHLHSILEKEIWIFGSGFEEGTSDKMMREVLEKHIEILGRKVLLPENDALTNDRPDLFLFRKIPQQRQRFEHLVVELKRPSLVLGDKEFEQIRKYARQVVAEERFDKESVKWKFLLVGNKIKEEMRSEITQKGQPRGCLVGTDQYDIYVCEWAEIFKEEKWKCAMLKQGLKEEAAGDGAKDFAYLKQNHKKVASSLGL